MRRPWHFARRCVLTSSELTEELAWEFLVVVGGEDRHVLDAALRCATRPRKRATAGGYSTKRSRRKRSTRHDTLALQRVQLVFERVPLSLFPHFLIMTKRKTKEVTYVYSSGSDSDFFDEPKQATRTKRRRTTKETVTDQNNREMRVGGQILKHATSRHIISNPKPLQTALLAWYSEVHEKRGMPWRKPFVPTSDAETRSQRAYEVCYSIYCVWFSSHDMQASRYGYLRSCFSKHK